MSLFHFHVRDEIGRVADEEGIDLPDVRAAFAEAHRSIREYLAGAEATPGLRFEITDQSGRVMLVIPFQPSTPEPGPVQIQAA